MPSTLYSQKDTEELNEKIKNMTSKKAYISEAIEVVKEVTPQAQAINKVRNSLIGEQGAAVFKLDSMTDLSDLNKLFASKADAHVYKNYFTTGSGVVKFSIDSTIYVPSSVTLLSGKKFEERYIKQLEKHIFTDNEELDGDKLIHFIMLIELIKKGTTPISIQTGKYLKSRAKIITALNKFFNKNYQVISSIHDMFSGSSRINPDQQRPSDV